MKLSKRALELLQLIFSENSNLQLPVGVAKEIIEIRKWAENQLKEENQENESKLKKINDKIFKTKT